jgi:hypothetical protein
MAGRGSSLQLARIFGIRVGAGASWFVVLFLLIYVLAEQFHTVLGGSKETAPDRRRDAPNRFCPLACCTSWAAPRGGSASPSSESSCGSSAACCRCAASPRPPGEEFKVAPPVPPSRSRCWR